MEAKEKGRKGREKGWQVRVTVIEGNGVGKEERRKKG